MRRQSPISTLAPYFEGLGKMIRNFLFIAVLIMAVVIPMFVVGDGTSGFRFRDLLGPSSTTQTVSKPTTSAIPDNPFNLDPELLKLIEPTAESGVTDADGIITPIAEALRFDVTPQYVVQRWTRVSTSVRHRGLKGMRVTLVTGTDPADLFGSVTYFFDGSNRVQRIMIQGYASDVGSIVEFVQLRFRLKEYSALSGRVFIAYQGHQPISLLRVQTAPVISNGNSHSRSEIRLEINAPTKGAILSDDSLEILDRIRENNLT